MIDQYPPANGVLTSLIWRKTAAGGETSLSGYDNASQALSYTPGQEQVYLNGILLVRGDDYTATNGTSITGLAALTANDFVQINCYNNFSVASLPSTSITGEISNNQITSLATSKLTGTIANNQLANSSITINGTPVSLGGSVSLPGDIESVTAGTGLSGGGTSGALTLTNSMATEITAKGDLIVGTGNATFDNLPAGESGATIVANSAAATGLSYKEDYAAGKNRIVNGAMTIDQRNAGASVSVSSAGIYTLDRWKGFSSEGGVYSVQRDSSAPAGFSNSLKVTVTTAATSLASTDNYSIAQEIEGYNVADFALGSASAKTFTLSFWVRSSLTGTFGGSFKNEDNSRSYPFTYSISVADTWEKKSITIEGVTSGTWNKTTGQGLRLFMAFGTGASRRGTAGVWGNDNYTGATGQTQIIETLNATWYITGVQVEIGSVATAFTPAAGTIQGELAACQRYLPAVNTTASQDIGTGLCTGTGTALINIAFQVPARVAPTGITASAASNFVLRASSGGGAGTPTGVAFNNASPVLGQISISGSSSLTAGDATSCLLNGQLLFTGCEL